MDQKHLSLKHVLLIGCIIILAFSLTGNILLYSQLFVSDQMTYRREQITNLQNQKTELKKQFHDLQNEIVQLKNQMSSFETQVDYLNHEIYSLQTENNLLLSEKANLEGQLYQLVLANQGKTATLVTRLGASDMRLNYSGQDLRLYISGEVWNVGQVEAKNCRLHVTLYQEENVANDTYVNLGNLEPGSYVEVAKNIYYSGQPLTNWKIIPESQ
jgi:hypothetical protein